MTKQMQINISRCGNETRAHVLILPELRCCHGSSRKHPNDADVPFLGALTAVTRAVTDGVAAGRVTPDEARQIIVSVCKRPEEVQRPISVYDEIMRAARAAGVR